MGSQFGCRFNIVVKWKWRDQDISRWVSTVVVYVWNDRGECWSLEQGYSSSNLSLWSVFGNGEESIFGSQSLEASNLFFL